MWLEERSIVSRLERLVRHMLRWLLTRYIYICDDFDNEASDKVIEWMWNKDNIFYLKEIV